MQKHLETKTLSGQQLRVLSDALAQHMDTLPSRAASVDEMRLVQDMLITVDQARSHRAATATKGMKSVFIDEHRHVGISTFRVCTRDGTAAPAEVVAEFPVFLDARTEGDETPFFTAREAARVFMRGLVEAA